MEEVTDIVVIGAAFNKVKDALFDMKTVPKPVMGQLAFARATRLKLNNMMTLRGEAIAWTSIRPYLGHPLFISLTDEVAANDPNLRRALNEEITKLKPLASFDGDGLEELSVTRPQTSNKQVHFNEPKVTDHWLKGIEVATVFAKEEGDIFLCGKTDVVVKTLLAISEGKDYPPCSKGSGGVSVHGPPPKMQLHWNKELVLITNLKTFKMEKKEINENVLGIVNSIFAAIRVPFLLFSGSGKTTRLQARFMCDGRSLPIQGNDFGLFKLESADSPCVWWLEVRGLTVWEISNDGTTSSKVPVEKVREARVSLFSETLIALGLKKLEEVKETKEAINLSVVDLDTTVESVEDEEEKVEATLGDPYTITPEDSAAIQEALEKEWEVPKPKSEVVTKRKLEWIGPHLTVEKIARLAVEILGKDSIPIDKEGQANCIKEAFSLIQGVTFMDYRRAKGRPAGTTSQTGREGSNFAKGDKVETEGVRPNRVTTRRQASSLPPPVAAPKKK